MDHVSDNDKARMLFPVEILDVDELVHIVIAALGGHDLFTGVHRHMQGGETPLPCLDE